MEIESEVGSFAGSDSILTIDDVASPLSEPALEPVPVTPEADEETVREVSHLELAFKAPSSYLLEIESVEPPIEAGERLFVTDGDTFWTYDSIADTYSREPIGSFAMVQWYFQPGAFAGVGDIAGLLQGMAARPGTTATLVGEETLLGRPVHVIEISPAYRGSTMSPDGSTVEYSGGVVRMWLDKEFLFTLRMELPQDEGASTWTMRVTEIQFNVEVSDDLFRFEPPAGAVEVPSSGGSTTSSGSSSSVSAGPGGIGLPAGFFTPAYLPAGYEGVSVGTTSDSNGEKISAEFLLKERAGDGRILVSERVRPDLPDALRRGRQITINGHDAWLDTANGEIALAWQEGGVVIVFAARGTSEDEVLRMAESMEVQGAIRDDPGFAIPVEEVVPVSPDGP